MWECYIKVCSKYIHVYFSSDIQQSHEKAGKWQEKSFPPLRRYSDFGDGSVVTAPAATATARRAPWTVFFVFFPLRIILKHFFQSNRAVIRGIIVHRRGRNNWKCVFRFNLIAITDVTTPWPKQKACGNPASPKPRLPQSRDRRLKPDQSRGSKRALSVRSKTSYLAGSPLLVKISSEADGTQEPVMSTWSVPTFVYHN